MRTAGGVHPPCARPPLRHARTPVRPRELLLQRAGPAPLCSVTAQPGGRPRKGVWEARTGGQARCRRPRTWVRKSRVSPRPRGSRLMKVVHLITCRPPGGDGVDSKGSGPLWDEGSSSFIFHLPQISQTSFRNKKKLVSDLEGKKKCPLGSGWTDCRSFTSTRQMSCEPRVPPGAAPRATDTPGQPRGYVHRLCVHSFTHSFIHLFACSLVRAGTQAGDSQG